MPDAEPQAGLSTKKNVDGPFRFSQNKTIHVRDVVQPQIAKFNCSPRTDRHLPDSRCGCASARRGCASALLACASSLLARASALLARADRLFRPAGAQLACASALHAPARALLRSAGALLGRPSARHAFRGALLAFEDAFHPTGADLNPRRSLDPDHSVREASICKIRMIQKETSETSWKSTRLANSRRPRRPCQIRMETC